MTKVEAETHRRPPPEEEVVRLLAAVEIMIAPPSGQAVAEANGWLMRLAESAGAAQH